MRRAGWDARTSVHPGEVTQRADSGEIVTTLTVKDLVVGINES